MFFKCWNHHCSHGICALQNHINSYHFSPFLFGKGWGKKSSKCVALFARLGRIGRLGQVQKNDPPTPRNGKFKGTLAPKKMTIGSWMTTFPFRMITFSGLNCWTSGGYYKGNGFNFTSNICCLIALNVRKVPSNHPCKFETKKNILHSIVLFLALPPTHNTKLPKTFEWIPKPRKSQQRPKAPPQGGTTSALLEKVVLKHLASMETRNKKQTHVLAEKQAQKFGIPSVF